MIEIIFRRHLSKLGQNIRYPEISLFRLISTGKCSVVSVGFEVRDQPLIKYMHSSNTGEETGVQRDNA